MRFTESRWLESNWERARVEGIAMMTYNPSIGRALARGGVIKFKKIAWHAVQALDDIEDRQAFDAYHHRLVRRTMRKIARTCKGKPMSYGEAQKAVNVFLKVFVDWAKLPNGRTANRLSGFLHVPLDSVVMGCIRREHRAKYDEVVAPIYRDEAQWPSDLRLSIISYRMYRGWQRFFRGIRPRRPIDLDVIWSLARRPENR
jgi:hypothetical protein